MGLASAHKQQGLLGVDPPRDDEERYISVDNGIAGFGCGIDCTCATSASKYKKK